MKELNKIQVINKNLHEIKNQTLRDYTGEFEVIGKLSIGIQLRTTHIRFRNNTDYESYIKAIDQDYASENPSFNGYIYKINSSIQLSY